MKKSTMLKILTPILLAMFIIQLSSGFFRSHLSMETFMFIHENGGIVIIVLVIIHLILNFNWIKANYFKK